MSTPTIPEVRYLTELLEALSNTAPHAGQSRNVVTDSYLSISGSGSPTAAYVDLINSIFSLEKLVVERFGEGIQQAALSVLNNIRQLFEIDELNLTWEQYRNKHLRFINSYIGFLPLFAALKFDADAFVAQRLGFDEEIAKLKGRIGKDAGLSDAARTVLFCQLELLGRSAARFEQSGFGPFRDSVFSVVGRVYFELSTQDDVSAEKLREVVDDVLRVANLIQIGGSLLTLAGPAIKLITGPK